MAVVEILMLILEFLNSITQAEVNFCPFSYALLYSRAQVVTTRVFARWGSSPAWALLRVLNLQHRKQVCSKLTIYLFINYSPQDRWMDLNGFATKICR